MKSAWRTSYLGFTNDKNPMQKARMENTLDNLIRHNGETMYEKEFAFAVLLDGYMPNREENYRYYSRRLDDYTKPKTRYTLEKDNSSYEVSKIIYDFVGYLIENSMDTLGKVIEYAVIEAEQLEKEQKEYAEKEVKEKEERHSQAEKDNQERKLKREKMSAEQYEQGKQFMKGDTIVCLESAVSELWNEIETFTDKNMDQFIEMAIESYTGLFGNREGMKSRVEHIFLDNSNQTNVQNKIDRLFLGKLFKINEDDKPITKTAKVNAFLDNREYKGAKEIEIEKYYIRAVNEGFKERQGEKKTIDGIVFYIEKFDGVYKATEARSGSSITTDKTKSELMKKVKAIIEDKKELLERNIENMVNKFGLSPLYEMEQAQ